MKISNSQHKRSVHLIGWERYTVIVKWSIHEVICLRGLSARLRPSTGAQGHISKRLWWRQGEPAWFGMGDKEEVVASEENVPLHVVSLSLSVCLSLSCRGKQ